MGAFLSNPQVNPQDYLRGMDVYEARRQVILRLIRDHFDNNQSRFVEATGVSASYVTRMLKGEDATFRKRIGDGMAMRLESVEALKLRPGDLMSPTLFGRAEAAVPAEAGPSVVMPPRTVGERPSTPDFTSRTVSDTDFGLLHDVKLMLPEDQLRDIQRRAALVRAEAEREIRERMAAASPAGPATAPPQPPAKVAGSEFKYKMENRPAQSRGILNSTIYQREQKPKKARG